MRAIIQSIAAACTLAAADPMCKAQGVSATADRFTKAPLGLVVDAVVIHPPFATDFVCAEHAEGQLKSIGDALGSDCTIVGGLDAGAGPATGFMRTHRGDGIKNEDWYGWNQPVLSPVDGVVERIHENPVVNSPGMVGRPPASFIIIRREDGVRVLLAHLQEIVAKAGDQVVAGRQIGRVGNNGFARMPHVHIGAWRDHAPLQIRMDLSAMGRLRSDN